MFPYVSGLEITGHVCRLKRKSKKARTDDVERDTNCRKDALETVRGDGACVPRRGIRLSGKVSDNT